jgi:hypothetical protein
VRTRVDENLRTEAVRFAFRFACDDCAHFDAGRGPERRGRCSLGFPAAPRRDAIDQTHLALCKSYELA